VQVLRATTGYLHTTEIPTVIVDTAGHQIPTQSRTDVLMAKRRRRSSRRAPIQEPPAQAAADIDPLTAPASAELAQVQVNPSAAEPELQPESEEPPEGVALFTEENPPDGALQWYWTQRHRYFSRYEEGIWMTHNSWFEVTAEAVAA